MKNIEDNAANNGIFQEFLALLGKLVHSELIRQIEFLKVQNEILRSKTSRRITVTPSERRRLLKFGLPLRGDLKKMLTIVGYSTFRKWASQKVEVNKPGTKRGRPKTAAQIRELILKMARENDWGYTRILGELKKLGIFRLSRNTVKNILKENGFDPGPKRGEDTWDDFIKRHFETLWACDFFTKTVWTLLGPKTFHILFFINVHTRKVGIAGITDHPKKEWVLEKTKSASFLFTDKNIEQLLIRDGDKKFTKEFDDLLKGSKIEVMTIPYKSPNLNPYAESWVGTIKRECLNKFFVFGEHHLEHLVQEFVRYYNTVRPHTGMNNMPLSAQSGREIESKSFLGGVLKDYRWN